MLKTVILTLAALVALSSNAEAQQRPKATGMHKDCNVLWPCSAPSASTPEQVRWNRGMYIQRQIGWGGPKAPIRPSKAHSKAAKAPSSPRHAAVTPSFGAPSPSLGYSIARPARYIGGRLVCALNVGAALAERGIKGTGSALALSYDGWGYASSPVPGAVAVTDRRGGGHVAIVSRVEGGRVFVWNATGSRTGWREIEYTHRRARYRVASQ